MLPKGCYLECPESITIRMHKVHKKIRKQVNLTAMIILLASLSGPLYAQFEQRLSVNLSAGYFNTIGWTGYEDEWWSPGDPYEPNLMPNFTAGVSLSGGLQYNFSRHLSVEFRLGYMYSPGWYYDYSDDGSEPFNYLYYEIYTDTFTYNIAASGENYMDLANFHVGIAPRYYFAPGRKLNPYLFGGISINYTDTYFDNMEYEAYKDLGREDEYTGADNLTDWFDYQVGIGFTAGVGAEYALNDYLGLFAQVDWHYIPLSEGAFYEGNNYANFQAINIHLGARISFFRSKEL